MAKQQEQLTVKNLQKSTEVAKNQLVTFINDLISLFNRSVKPTPKKYKESVKLILIGALVMGLVGFLVKIASIPINTILLGGSK